MTRPLVFVGVVAFLVLGLFGGGFLVLHPPKYSKPQEVTIDPSPTPEDAHTTGNYIYSEFLSHYPELAEKYTALRVKSAKMLSSRPVWTADIYEEDGHVSKYVFTLDKYYVISKSVPCDASNEIFTTTTKGEPDQLITEYKCRYGEGQSVFWYDFKTKEPFIPKLARSLYAPDPNWDYGVDSASVELGYFSGAILHNLTQNKVPMVVLDLGSDILKIKIATHATVGSLDTRWDVNSQERGPGY